MTALDTRPIERETLPIAPTPQNPAPRRGGRMRAWATRHRASITWLSPILALSAVVQAINLGGSPQRIDDEGTYTAQAWAVNNLGELAHYTFWYDHPPVGWLQIAAWTGLTGGFQRYDIAVLAAREAMVVATVVSVALLWFLARRIGLGRGAAGAAGLVFAISPLAVQFHRSVYLDNVATPWLLASMLLAMTRRHQLAGFAASSVALGIAVLSKETYLLALPLVAWLMWKNALPETRRYTLSVAATLLVLIGGSYIMLALVKGELTPGADRVSLVDGILFQLGARESSGSILDPQSLSAATTAVWLQLDPVLTVLAPVAAVAGIAVKRVRPFAITLAALIAFMFRPGGYLPVPYVIMLLPLAALVIAGVTDAAIRSLRARSGARRLPNVAWLALTATAAVLIVPAWGTQLRGLLLSDLDKPSRDAQSWIADNVTRDSRLIVDDAMWVDLVEAGFDRDNVIWFYKLDTDPAVQAQSPNGWADSDFIVTTDSMVTSPNAASAGSAIENSVVVASFGEGDQQVEVRRILPEGVDAAQQSIDAVAELRLVSGSELIQNPGIEIDVEDSARLGAGQVDERIVVSLAQLVESGQVSVVDFPIVTGEEDLAFRQVVIRSVGGDPLVADGRATPAARELLEQLDGRFGPESAAPVADGLLLTFSVIAPDGLVS
ncbi:MAG: hypothetical protein RI885_1655 [Actinomycetota bacterium]|jgi:4-amino-4-deoxy-L-arabinose transferase-like glycosyltransferase